MIGILVVSHEPLGTALLNCTRHVFGRLPVQLAALDVIPDEDPEAAYRSAHDLMSRINDGSGVLVLTDCYGATPARVASRLAEPHRVVVLAGVNLPMLLKALGNRRGPLEEMVKPILDSATRAIVEVTSPPAADGACTAAPEPGHASR
jgi:PTS system ascorbate-specific IIA component